MGGQKSHYWEEACGGFLINYHLIKISVSLRTFGFGGEDLEKGSFVQSRASSRPCTTEWPSGRRPLSSPSPCQPLPSKELLTPALRRFGTTITKAGYGKTLPTNMKRKRKMNNWKRMVSLILEEQKQTLILIIILSEVHIRGR